VIDMDDILGLIEYQLREMEWILGNTYHLMDLWDLLATQEILLDDEA